MLSNVPTHSISYCYWAISLSISILVVLFSWYLCWRQTFIAIAQCDLNILFMAAIGLFIFISFCNTLPQCSLCWRKMFTTIMHWTEIFFYSNYCDPSLMYLVLNWKINLYHATCDMNDFSNSYWGFYVCHILKLSRFDVDGVEQIQHISLVTAWVQSVPSWFDMTEKKHSLVTWDVIQTCKSIRLWCPAMFWPMTRPLMATFPHSCHQSEQRVAQQK